MQSDFGVMAGFEVGLAGSSLGLKGIAGFSIGLEAVVGVDLGLEATAGFSVLPVVTAYLDLCLL